MKRRCAGTFGKSAQGGLSALDLRSRLCELLPESGFPGGEERILAGVPAEKMGCAGVGGVVITGFPDFVEQERAGLIGAAMQVELQAALFLARGRDQGA